MKYIEYVFLLVLVFSAFSVLGAICPYVNLLIAAALQLLYTACAARVSALEVSATSSTHAYHLNLVDPFLLHLSFVYFLAAFAVYLFFLRAS